MKMGLIFAKNSLEIRGSWEKINQLVGRPMKDRSIRGYSENDVNGLICEQFQSRVADPRKGVAEKRVSCPRWSRRMSRRGTRGCVSSPVYKKKVYRKVAIYNPGYIDVPFCRARLKEAPAIPRIMHASLLKGNASHLG